MNTQNRVAPKLCKKPLQTLQSPFVSDSFFILMQLRGGMRRPFKESRHCFQGLSWVFRSVPRPSGTEVKHASWAGAASEAQPTRWFFSSVVRWSSRLADSPTRYQLPRQQQWQHQAHSRRPNCTPDIWKIRMANVRPKHESNTVQKSPRFCFFTCWAAKPWWYRTEL